MGTLHRKLGVLGRPVAEMVLREDGELRAAGRGAGDVFGGGGIVGFDLEGLSGVREGWGGDGGGTLGWSWMSAILYFGCAIAWKSQLDLCLGFLVIPYGAGY